MKKKIFTTSCSAVAFAAMSLIISCTNKENNETTQEYTLEDNIVTVPAESPLTARLSVETVKPHKYNQEFVTSGEVRAIPSNYAEVGVPFAGRIAASFVNPGDKVSAGSPLFSINSSEFMEVCRTAYDSRTEMEQASRALSRTQRMYEGKMASARELEEAQAEYDIKSRAAANAAASLKVFGTDINSIVPGEALIVRSPIAGVVMSNNLVNGQYVKDDADVAVVVANISKVWVVANVKEHDFPTLKNATAVNVSVDALPDSLIQGKIFHINDILDYATRTAEMIVECENQACELKPNMFCSVIVYGSDTEALLVPNSALRRNEDIVYVMRSLGNGRYEAVKIETGVSVNGYTPVLSGLQPGDEVVTKGSFYLPEIQF